MGKKDIAPIVNQPLTSEALDNNAQPNVGQAKALEKGQTANAKTGKQPNRKSSADKKPNVFVRFFKKIGNAFRDMWGERKNVTWPTFAKVAASTGVVLLVVGIFFAVLMGFNSLFTYILNLIINL